MDNPWLHVLFLHRMHKPLKVTWSSPNPHIHDLVFWLCTLFDPTLDSFNVSMIMVRHPCLYILKWSWVIFFNLLKHINIGVFIHLLVFHWFIVIWKCRLIHKLRLYTTYNIPHSASHWFWTWDFLWLIKNYKIPALSWSLEL